MTDRGRNMVLMGLGAALCAALMITLADDTTNETAPEDDQDLRQPDATDPAGLAGVAPSTWPGTAAIQVAPSATQVFELPERTWYDDRLMVRVQGDPELVAAALGTHLLRSPGPSGLLSLAVPEGMDRETFRGQVQGHPDVLSARRVGAVYGAGKGSSKEKKDSSSDATSSEETVQNDWSATYLDQQWHHDPLNTETDLSYSFRDVLVAVLDSGVAYEDHSDETGDYVALPGLSESKFMHPYDFVNDDEHANDDHQHGTHITCLIACTGDTLGLAPEAKIMPVKVLDENLEGDETALIDGLWHAIDHEAHVINLSLSFAPDYAPSAELIEVLQAAYDADILVVAAAGNWSGSQATWPARSPLVMGVAANEVAGWEVEASGSLGATVQPSSYTNLGSGVVLTAPGGNLDVDIDGDGLVDGILAETIDPYDPSSTGLWLMSGSSQAAALASGSALHFYANGYGRQEAWGAMIESTGSHADGSALDDGAGTGRLKTKNAINKVTSHAATMTEEHTVSFVPYLVDNGDGTVTPTALVHLVDSNDEHDQAEVYVSFHGASDAIDSCTPADASGCLVYGEAVDASGDAELWWTVQVDGVERESALWPTRSALYSSDALNSVLVAIEEDEGEYVPLGWYWEAGTDADLGELAESAVVMDVGAGFASSPMGLLMNGRTVSSWFTVEEVSVDLDGTGFASSPMGSSKVRYMRGSGFASSPMGSSRVATMRGSGFASSPMGTAVATISDSSNGDFFSLHSDDLSRKQSRTPLGEVVTSGSLLLDDGSPVASSLAASLSGGDGDDAIQALTVEASEYTP